MSTTEQGQGAQAAISETLQKIRRDWIALHTSGDSEPEPMVTRRVPMDDDVSAKQGAPSVYPALHFTKVLSVFLGAFAVLCRHHGVAARGVLRFENGVFAVGDREFRLADVDSVTVEGDRVVIDTLPNGLAHMGSRKGQA